MKDRYIPDELARGQIRKIMAKTGLDDMDVVAASIGLMELIVDLQAEGKQVGVMGSNPAATIASLVNAGPDVLKEWRADQ